MRRRFVLYTGACLSALIAAGISWAWSGSRLPATASPSRSALAVRQPPRSPLPLAPAPARGEREPALRAEALALPDASGVAWEVPPPAVPANTLPASNHGAAGDTAAQDTAARDRVADDTAAADFVPSLPDDTAVPEPESAARPAPARPRTREVSLVRLRLWSQPGMCAAAGEALSARQVLSARFRYWDGGELGLFHVDPRLPLDAPTPILGYIADAERELARRLKLSVARPETFLYFDEQLLTAAACISPNVVAYYDGALHVAASNPELINT
jgi:hypothetical protein